MAFFGLFKARPKEEEEARNFLFRFLNDSCFRHEVTVEEKRWERRTNLVVGVWIIPLCDGSPVLSRAYPTVTRDFTTSGLSVVVNSPLSCKEVLVALPAGADRAFLRCKITHISPIGEGFFAAGLHVLGLSRGNQYPGLSKLAPQ